MADTLKQRCPECGCMVELKPTKNQATYHFRCDGKHDPSGLGCGARHFLGRKASGEVRAELDALARLHSAPPRDQAHDQARDQAHDQAHDQARDQGDQDGPKPGDILYAI